MAIESNVTLTFLAPIPKAAQKKFDALLDEHGFSTDWDGEPVCLRELPPGKTTLMARDLGFEQQQAFVKLGKKHRFSLTCHGEWPKDYESECKGSVIAFDATDGREIDCMATCGTGEPLLTLEDALSKTAAELQREFGLPADLLDKPGPPTVSP